MKNRISWTIWVIVLTINIILAQIDTDRPAYTNSTQIIPKFMLQVEGGIHSSFFKYDNENKDYSTSLPNTFIRFGLSNNAELRLEVPSVNRYKTIRKNNDYSNGIELNNVSLGVKSKIYKGDKLNISGISTLFFQEKYRKWVVTPLEFGVSLNMPFSYTLNSTSSIAGSMSLTLIDGFTTFGSSILYGKFIRPKLWVQGEYYNAVLYDNWGTSTNYYVTHYTNWSGQYTLSPKCKVDLTLGTLVNNNTGNRNFVNSPNLTSQVGISFLF